MNTSERIAEINRKLEQIGSVFRTDDGLTIVGYFGHLLFLRRTYKSIEELEQEASRALSNARGVAE